MATIHNFSGVRDSEFYSTLRTRVNDYFKNNEISIHSNSGMVTKTVVMSAIFLIPLILMLTGLITAPWAVLLLWIVMGFGKGGIGMCIMHDAVHGAYSGNPKVNKFLGYSMNLLGGNATLWKFQHNILHHTYTNIDGSDEDIHVPSFLLRFSPHQKRYWIHRFQFLYVWFFYSLSTLLWAFAKDYGMIVKLRRKGLIPPGGKFRKTLSQLLVWKVAYFGYLLVLPLLLIPVSPWLVISGFVLMHLVAGLSLSLVFQLAHVMPSTEYPLPDLSGKIDNNWAVHQMETTTNFAPNSKIFSWLIGGLNYQVEHHLFTNICHIHYPRLSPIVAETAREFGVRYNSYSTFFIALSDHIKMLRNLGRK